MMDCRCLHAGIDPSHDHENSVLRGLGREGGGELHYLYYAFILSVRSYIGPFTVSENNV